MSLSILKKLTQQENADNRVFSTSTTTTTKKAVAEKNTPATQPKKEEYNKAGFIKIDHAAEAAKLKKSNEPGHLQFSILQASYESKSHYITDNLWQDILNTGVEIMEKNNYTKNLVIIEIGAHEVKQSADAAKLKYHAYCVEPSPKSFQSMHSATCKLIDKEPELAPYIHLLNRAAGAETGNTLLEFNSAGSTGDHVSDFNMWKMTAGSTKDANLPKSKKGKIVKNHG